MIAGHQGAAGSDVWAPGVYNSFLREIMSSRETVAGGVFVGTLIGSLRIEGVISILSDGRASAEVLNDENWRWVESVWQEFYSRQSLVGWYCSRPGLGAVPTDRDVAAHMKYFGTAESILVCADPASGTLIGYALTNEGVPVEVVRGDMNLPAIEAPAGARGGAADRTTALAVALGIGAGLLLFMLSGASGWPFS